MKAIDAGFIAVRLLGLWFLFVGLLGLPTSLSWMTWAEVESDTRMLGVGFTVAYLVVLVLAGWVFVNAWKVARFLFSSADDLELTSPAGAVQAVAFSVVGAVWVMGAIPQLVDKLVSFLWVLRAGAETEREAFLSSSTFFETLYAVVTLGVGGFVLVRSRWLVERWAGFQKPAGERAVSTPEEQPGD